MSCLKKQKQKQKQWVVWFTFQCFRESQCKQIRNLFINSFPKMTKIGSTLSFCLRHQGLERDLEDLGCFFHLPKKLCNICLKCFNLPLALFCPRLLERNSAVRKLKPRGKITAPTNFAEIYIIVGGETCKSSDVSKIFQNRGPVRPKPKWRYVSQWKFFLLPFKKIILDQQLQLVLPTITRRVVMSKLRKKIKEAKKGN